MSVHLTPNWREPVRETYGFRTTLFTSESGKEQRTAERLRPRRMVSFSGVVAGDSMRALQGALINRTASPITIPDPARTPALLEEPAPVGSTILRLANFPTWLRSVSNVSLSDWQRSEFRPQTLQSFMNLQFGSFGAFTTEFDPDDFDVNRRAQITLATPLDQSWPAGTQLRPVLSGWLDNETRVDYPTSDVMRYSANVTVVPGTVPLDLGGKAFSILGGYNLLDEAPNWAAPMSAAFLTPIERVDYDRGIVAPYLPIDFHTMITQMDYLSRTRETVGYVLKMFLAARGRQGEFYCPTWRNDLLPLSGIPPAGDTLFVHLDAQQHRDSSVLKAIRITLNDGRVYHRQITQMQAVNNAGIGDYSTAFDTAFSGGAVGNATRLTLDNPIFAGLVQRRDIASIGWTPRCRFASDTLTIDWLTDDVARTTAQIMTLEHL